MNNRVADYTFTIIEDGQVPLAGDFSSASFAPVIAVVAVTLLLLLVATYTVWVFSHARKVSALRGCENESIMECFFHPIKLMRTESELEYEIVSDVSHNLA